MAAAQRLATPASKGAISPGSRNGSGRDQQRAFVFFINAFKDIFFFFLPRETFGRSSFVPPFL
jgi:hypothetical protein